MHPSQPRKAPGRSSSYLTMLQASQSRLAFALGLLSGLEELVPDVVSLVCERVIGAPVAQATAWARHLSHELLTFDDGDATTTKAFEGAPLNAAALVPVRRGVGAAGFALAALVEAMPEADSGFSFGVGRGMAIPSSWVFGGLGADGTCGMCQAAANESTRGAGTTRFGRRTDREDYELGRAIEQGSRLALHLSPRGAEGTRTARFFVDGSEVAVFAGIEDDGGSSDWVAGVTLSEGARVRIVPAEAEELAQQAKLKL